MTRFMARKFSAEFIEKLHINSSRLVVLIAVYFTTVLNIPIWRYIYANFANDGLKNILFVCSLAVLIFAVMLLITSLCLFKTRFFSLSKIILSALIVISSIACYMSFSYGVYIDEDMIQNVLETTKREAFALVTAKAVIWTLIFGVLPSVLLCITKINFAPIKRELRNRFIISFSALVIIGALVTINTVFYYDEYRTFLRQIRKQYIYKIATPINYIIGTAKHIRRIQLANREFLILDENAEYLPKDDTKYRVFVFIVGETARAQNFSLGGYSKNTNPNLQQLGDIIYFNSVSSCGTATAISVPCIFSSVERKSFDVADAKYMENMIDIAYKTGYEVLWKNNNDGCKGVCDRVGLIDVITTENAFRYCDESYCFDEILLDGFEDYLSNIKQNTFIVFHTIGSHGPKYYERYPARHKLFTPTCDTGYIQECSNEALVNTYDNTIAYTDFVIAETIKTLTKFPEYNSALLYVSDHGESLGEKASSYQSMVATTVKGDIARGGSGEIYLHGMPYTIAPLEQKKVPMVLWLSENIKTADHIEFNCIKNNAKTLEYSHDYLFHSILSLLNIKTKIYNENLDIFAPCRT